MSSDFSLPLSVAQPLRGDGYRLIEMREITKPDGMSETTYVWRFEPPDESAGFEFDEEERILISAALVSHTSSAPDHASRYTSVWAGAVDAVVRTPIKAKREACNTNGQGR